MLKKLSIKNFKSIVNLDIECMKINLFIGKPNTGKSNILECLGYFSYFGHGDNLANYIRHSSENELFYDKDTTKKIEIIADSIGKYGKITREKNKAYVSELPPSKEIRQPSVPVVGPLRPVKMYKFRVPGSFGNREIDYLHPPYGNNLLEVVEQHKALRKIIGNLIRDYNYEFLLEKTQNKLFIQKKLEEGVVVQFDYKLISDSLQRAIFYMAAMLSNKKSVILLEEPETHIFPYYVKYLAENIAADMGGNQFFISTHNPYFLLSILEKCHKAETGVHITYYEGHETKVKTYTGDELSRLLDVDVFFNIDKLI